MLNTTQGERVGGRYVLDREIARGGMGSVWLGHDEKLRRKVAIKLLGQNWTERSDARTRFEREAMAVAQLQSPHIIQIFDYGVEGEIPYIVMEMLEGEDLRTRLQKRKRLSLETTGRILVQTAKALSVAHAAAIVHRDLKPGNIFLARGRDEELVKVLDFGVAKTLEREDLLDSEQTKEGSILGTPQFMAPEQARGVRRVDHRADLWSLGVIVFKCLTGRLPFSGKTAADLIVKICTRDAPKATRYAPDLPRDVDAFFKRALARSPKDRFDSAKAMAIAFGRITPVALPSLSMSMPEIPADLLAALRRADDDDDDSLSSVLDDLGVGPERLREVASSRRPPPPRRAGTAVPDDEQPTQFADSSALVEVAQGASDDEDPATLLSDSGNLQVAAKLAGQDADTDVSAPGPDTAIDDDDAPTDMERIIAPDTLNDGGEGDGGADDTGSAAVAGGDARPRVTSNPTFGGGLVEGSMPPPSQESGSRRPVVFVGLAIAAGVMLAAVGSRVVGGGEAESKAEGPTAAASTTAPKRRMKVVPLSPSDFPNRRKTEPKAEGTSAQPSPPKHAARIGAAGPFGQPTGAKPVPSPVPPTTSAATTPEPPPPEPTSEPAPVKPSAQPPPPAPPAKPPPPAPPPPPPPPPDQGDPFAERL